MVKNKGNSNEITRSYLDRILIETRYLDSACPDLTFQLYGETFPSPVMTAALSHLDHFMFEGATEAYAMGAKETGTVLWLGMAPEKEVELCVGAGARVIEIIKPYSNRDLIYRKIDHAVSAGLLAVGIDIDHPFGEDGSKDLVDGFEMSPMTTRELAEICAYSPLPVIAKGVLSTRDADRAVCAGAKGLVLSHHNNRIRFALPPLAILPEISRVVGQSAELFVDGEISCGMDAFKALALGAKGVCIGRPLMGAIKADTEHGMRDYLREVNAELAKAMAYTGCIDLSHMDPSVLHIF